jgi:excisionase family DNA binding protein
MIEHSWLSTKEAAQLLDVSQRTIQNWVDTGKLKSTKTLGGHRRLMRSDVEGFLVLRTSTVPAALPAMAAEPPAADELRVLIVEDDRTLLRLYELKFGEFTVPHQLFLAANGYQGLLLAGKHCPHLVIADLNMPEMNGLQLIQEIRKTADMKDSKTELTQLPVQPPKQAVLKLVGTTSPRAPMTVAFYLNGRLQSPPQACVSTTKLS